MVHSQALRPDRQILDLYSCEMINSILPHLQYYRDGNKCGSRARTLATSRKQMLNFAAQTKTMYNILLRSHSGLRWVILALVLGAIFRAFTNISSGKFTPLDDKLTLFSLISAHIQLLLGLGLYFISPWVEKAMANGMGAAMKDSVDRFWAVEHIFGMVIGIALITIGRIASKKAVTDTEKFKKVAVYFSIGLLIILATIPWPFREHLGRGWF